MNIKKIGVTVGMLVTTSVLLTSCGSSSGITEKSYEKGAKGFSFGGTYVGYRRRTKGSR